MEELNTNETVACPVCNTNAQQADAFCGKCGYPLKGEKKEQEDFKQTQYQLEANLSVANHQIRKGTIILYVLSGLLTLMGILLGFVFPSSVAERYGSHALDIGITNIVVGVLFFGLALWSRKRGFAALLIALILFCTIQIMSAISNPKTISSGLILKGIAIVLLIQGTVGGYKAEKIKKELHLKSY